MKPHEFYSFRCEAADEPTSAELMIFAAIGDWEEMGDVSARGFAKSLGELPTSVKRLDIHINSPGGSVFEAQAIYSRLADHRSTKHVYVDGLAASAASIIAMVGHKIYIRANANMMIHLPSGIVMGNADDMRQMVAALDSITESMINVYAKRTGLEREEIRSLLGAETWFSPQDAVDKGFADEVRGVVKAAAVVGNNRIVINGVEHDLSRFHNVPAFSATTQIQPMRTLQPKAATTTTTTEDPPAPPTPPTAPTPPAAPPEPPAPPTAPTAPAAPPPTAAAPPTDYDKGVTAERERIAALQKLDKPATHAIITKAIAEGKTVNDIAAECVEAMSKGVQNRDRYTDAASLDGIPPSEAGNGNSGSEFGAKLKAAVQKRVDARNRNVRVNSRN